MTCWNWLFRAVVKGGRRALVLAAPVIMLITGQAAFAQGLSYQKATDLVPNIFPSDAFTIAGFPTDDNLWGLRTTFGTNNDLLGPNSPEIWEAGIAEDVPELRQLVSGLTPGNTYDVYAAFWTDDDENWTIRAGVESGNLTLYSYTGEGGRFPVAGSLHGVSASMAVWDNPPPPTKAGTLFVEPRPPSTEPFQDPLVMLLGYAGTAMANASGEINVFVDDLPFSGGVNRTWFDGVAYVDAGTPVAATASLDRVTGELTLINPTAQDFEIRAYEIRSFTAGAINAVEWTPFSATNPSWFVTEPADPANTPFGSVIGEDGGGTTITLAAGGGSLSFGNIWNQSAFDHLYVFLTLDDGSVDGQLAVLAPHYVGDFVFGDLTGDGAIGLADYEILLNNMHTNVSALTVIEGYQQGDLTADGVINFFDFAAFRAAFDAANGAGSFAQMVPQVPEPSTFLGLLIMGGLLAVYRRRRFIGSGLALMICCTLASTSSATTLLRVDMNDRSNPVLTAPGFQPFTLVPETTGLQPGATATLDGYTVTLSGIAADGTPGTVDDRVRPTPAPTATLTLSELYRDFIFTNPASHGIDLTVSGGALQPNTQYLVGIYSFDTGSTGVQRTANWLDGNNNNALVASTSFIGTASPSVDDQYKFLGPAQTNGAGELFLQGRNTIPDFGNFGVFLNGFEISELIALTLEVNTDSGAVRITNETGDSIDMSYYEIRSASGSLNVGGWSTLGSPPIGTDWDTVPNSDANLLSEVNLQSMTSVGQNGSVSLGSAFTIGGAQDLQFFYAGPGETALQFGLVSYVSGVLPGDFNNDGRVDAADYTVWRDGLGTAFIQADYQDWRGNFGAGLGSGSLAPGAVPEPGTAGLALLATLLAGAAVRRRI